MSLFKLEVWRIGYALLLAIASQIIKTILYGLSFSFLSFAFWMVFGFIAGSFIMNSIENKHSSSKNNITKIIWLMTFLGILFVLHLIVYLVIINSSINFLFG
jgi:hypothetical protein